MHDMIQNGPPQLTAVNRNDHEDTLEARVPCLVDGYAAEFRIEFNTKEQRYSRYTISMFEPVGLAWHQILSWGMTEVGRINTFPEDELLQQLRGVGEVMWAYANVIVGQSSRRQEDVEIGQYVDERRAYDAAVEAETLGDDAVDLVREPVQYNDDTAMTLNDNELSMEIHGAEGVN